MTRIALVIPWLVSCGAAPGTPARVSATPTETGPSASARASQEGTAPPGAPAASSVATPGAPRMGACPDDMVDLRAFCMDRYEAPNIEGQLPYALKTAYDGEAWCAERGKRLCTEEEWVRACGGAEGRMYPYGDRHRAGACNDDHPWIPVHWNLLAKWPSLVALEEARRLFQGEPSGVRSACVSAEGVHDLTGNVAEWVRRSDPAPRPGYDHVLKGCYWAGCYHQPEPNCVFRNSAHPGSFRTYEAGFRCCRGLP